MFFLPVLIPAYNSSSLAFLMMCSVYRLNKQGNNRDYCTPFSILNQSVVSYRVLTVASWLTYRFLRRQVRWSGIPISLRVFHSWLWSTVKGFSIANETEIDVFLEFSCFLKLSHSLSRVWLFAILWTVAHQAPPSMGFSRQEYWSGLPFSSPGVFPTQGSNPGLPHCRQML